MLFNSIQFALFFAVVYILYLFLDRTWQNRMLLVASCVFYASWDWRFLFLIFVTIITDYFCGRLIHNTEDIAIRRSYLCLSIFVNLSILGFFKYFNFFETNLVALANAFGLSLRAHYLHIILPLGVSFYTFCSMSYTIDIYRRDTEPTAKFLDYALFISFFPHLLAGPIMRAKTLLSQIVTRRNVSMEKFSEGCYLIAFGLFQKNFVADNLARIVEPVFSASPPYNGLSVLLASYAFAFQIFCDFGGYSNMARGLGMLMGFDITVNFTFPFFVTNVQDYWQNWHISLSSWIRDYIYIPLFQALRHIRGNLRIYLSLVCTMALMGLWHGAAWKFVAWGLYYGLLLCAYILVRTRLRDFITPKDQVMKRLWFWIRVMLMFHITVIGMMIFRANSLSQISYMLQSLVLRYKFTPGAFSTFKYLLFYLWFLGVIMIMQFKSKDLSVIRKLKPLPKVLIYTIMAYLLFVYSAPAGTEFIYFQF